ncbi:hypothetical protein EXIGLDRAFT_213220 [Exidia glandulosa HHB12029]|uniref:Uncharacterized protein n=1 Tax=Exidia glandulosa HHB12029 TaxID=1314781 RepID=A0A165EI45_EXIGL|nr:hypothetical protein EXIGLDRAFT_213220 [Exidia glandulosa HHB12029]
MFTGARTIVAHSRARLHEFLGALKPTPDRTLLFALSSNAWDQSILQRLASLGSHSVGCISAPLPGSRHLETLSLAFVREVGSTTMRWEHPEAAPSSDDWAADALGHDTPQAKDESSTFSIDNPNLSSAAHTIVAFSTKPHAVSFHDSIARRYPHAVQAHTHRSSMGRSSHYSAMAILTLPALSPLRFLARSDHACPSSFMDFTLSLHPYELQVLAEISSTLSDVIALRDTSSSQSTARVLT